MVESAAMDADGHGLRVPGRKPRAIVIAGPNGAGKTTFAREFLTGEAACPTFLNADLIAAGLSPFAPEEANIAAMRLMARRIRDLVAQREDFAVESTLAGRAYGRMIREWQAAGYAVRIIYLRLDSADLAVRRVAQRVALGGHHVPEDVVRRRYESGWTNFKSMFRELADAWQVYDATETHQCSRSRENAMPEPFDDRSDLAGSQAAMLRAARNVRRLHKLHGVPMAVSEGGKVVLIPPEDILVDEPGETPPVQGQ